MIRKRHSIRTAGFADGSDFDDSIDLHGMSCQEAEKAVRLLLQQCSSGEKILVIHGKGTGKLKEHIRRYLKSCASVCNICYGEKSGLPGKDGVCLVSVR